MHGSIHRGYLDAPKPMREFNVRVHALACRAVFEAPWEKVITPLDTCGNVVLETSGLQGFARPPSSKASASPAAICLDNHLGWYEQAKDWPKLQHRDPNTQSSILYDLVAVYLAFAEDLLDMQNLPIKVTPDGERN